MLESSIGLGALVTFIGLYLGIIFLSVMGFKKKNKKLKIVSISLLVLAILFTTIIVIIYG